MAAAKRKHKKPHLARQNFFRRENLIGKTRQSKLFNVVGCAGKEGITRNQVLTFLKRKKEIKDQKDINATNYLFDDLQKKLLFKKQEGRNAKYKLTAKGRRELLRIRKIARKNGVNLPKKIDLKTLPEKAS